MKNPEKFAFLNKKNYISYCKDTDDVKKAQEYKIWYEGNINKILEYYKTNKDRIGRNTLYYTPSFMKLAPTGDSVNIGGGVQINNFTVYHNPLPNIISRAMSNLLFSTTPKVSISTKNKNRTEVYQEILDMTLRENNIGSLLQKSAELESYSGSLAFKPILDTDFSDYPILQVYSKEDFILNKQYDKIVSIVFKDSYIVDKNIYTLLSEYGYGYIKYKLIDDKDKEVPLDTLSETSGLIDLVFVDQEGNQLNQMLAIYKENRPGAKSDYENSIDDFNAIDEAYSNMMNYIRKTAPKRVVSESTLKQTEDGSPIIPSVYDSDLIIRWDNNPSPDAKEVNELQQTTDINNSIQGYISTMAEIQKSIARTVGLSIKTIMAEDMAGANSSGDALSIRENIDLKTRDNKLISWKETLLSLFKLLLILNTREVVNNVVNVNTLNEVDLNIEFYNPATPTFEQEVQEVRELIDAGLIDHLGGLMRLWVNSGLKSEEEVLEMYAKLQGEVKTEQQIVNQEINNENEESDMDNDDSEDMEDEEDVQ